MYYQITANKRKTWLLIAVVGGLLAVLAWLAGRAYGLDIYSAAAFGIIFSTVYALVSYFTGDKAALAVPRAQEIQKVHAMLTQREYRISPQVPVASSLHER